jgi:hypothetical protein
MHSSCSLESSLGLSIGVISVDVLWCPRWRLVDASTVLVVTSLQEKRLQQVK